MSGPCSHSSHRLARAGDALVRPWASRGCVPAHIAGLISLHGPLSRKDAFLGVGRTFEPSRPETSDSCDVCQRLARGAAAAGTAQQAALPPAAKPSRRCASFPFPLEEEKLPQVLGG